MKTALQIFVGLVASLLMLVACSLNAQCTQDTVVIVAPLSETVYGIHASDTLACYTPACGCEKTFRVLVPPMDGCITIVGPANPSASVIILRNCNEVLLDTCVAIVPQVNIVTICYQSPDTTQMVICSFDSAAVVIRAYIQPGSLPLGSPIVALDTLCPIVGLMHPMRLDTILVGSFNMQGRPWDGSGIRVDLYQTGTTYFTRKWWDVYK